MAVTGKERSLIMSNNVEEGEAATINTLLFIARMGWYNSTYHFMEAKKTMRSKHP